ncbi:hypothetical protein Fcan01_28486 [Folsomia candida]|uniref:Uncharacterized protein n=1 Tax=Folsomia candida TaxID=158441 RepID=A0A226CXI0_FOLCA|nr:hypothetical protein Fcan01_28486 [Folsomia candida]
MFSAKFLPIPKFHLKFCKFLNCIPFRYSENLGRLVPIKNGDTLFKFKLQCVLSTLYCGAMGANIFLGGLSTTEKLQGSIFLMAYLIGAVSRWNYELSPGPIQVINSFLQYEAGPLRDLLHISVQSGIVKVMRTFIWLMEFSICVIPILQLVLLIYAPCTAPFILSMIPNCGERSNRGFQVGIHLFESWMGYHTMYSGATWLCYVLLGGITGFLEYLKIL